VLSCRVVSYLIRNTTLKEKRHPLLVLLRSTRNERMNEYIFFFHHTGSRVWFPQQEAAEHNVGSSLQRTYLFATAYFLFFVLFCFLWGGQCSAGFSHAPILLRRRTTTYGNTYYQLTHTILFGSSARKRCCGIFPSRFVSFRFVRRGETGTLRFSHPHNMSPSHVSCHVTLRYPTRPDPTAFLDSFVSMNECYVYVCIY